MVDSISTLNSNVETQASEDAATLAGDLDAFLLLLTVQLQNQDPLSPLEPTEFTGQLVQFASVEQQIATNDTMEQLLAVENASLAASVVGFIGTEVEATGSVLPLQDGSGTISYTLGDNAKATVITIFDDQGRVVYNESGETTAGTHELVWDGKDSDGVQLSDGAYTINVTPVGFDDESIANIVAIRAKITGVNMESGTTLLEADGVAIPLDNVLSIKEQTTTATE